MKMHSTGHMFAYDGPQLFDDANDFNGSNTAIPPTSTKFSPWGSIIPSSQSCFDFSDSHPNSSLQNKQKSQQDAQGTTTKKPTMSPSFDENLLSEFCPITPSMLDEDIPLATTTAPAPQAPPRTSTAHLTTSSLLTDAIPEDEDEQQQQPHSTTEPASHSTNTPTSAPSIERFSSPSPFALLANFREELTKFCTSPPPPGLIIYCCVTRNKRGMERGFYPTYYLHLEHCMGEALSRLQSTTSTQNGDEGGRTCSIDKEALLRAAKAELAHKGVFLLAARKRKYSRTSNYLISVDPTDLHREGEAYVGKVRSNALGTEFTLFDSAESGGRLVLGRGGEFRSGSMRRSTSFRRSARYYNNIGRNSSANSTLSASSPLGAPSGIRSELASVVYEQNIFGFKGPRKFTAIIPALSGSGERISCTPVSHHDGLLAYWKSGLPAPIIPLHNKSPVWNEDTQSYVLNFHGRVTQASVKNFQLVRDNDVENIILQFGRVSKDVFTLDFTYPLSALQAFGIVLTSFDGKLACE